MSRKRGGRVGMSHSAKASDLRMQMKHRPVTTRKMTEEEWQGRKRQKGMPDDL